MQAPDGENRSLCAVSYTHLFDIIMYTEFGTTYNSYVMKAGDKTILFETAKEKFFDDYLEKLEEITEVTKIDYLVVNHTEPDHAGSVERLLELNPGLKIIATGCAVGFLKAVSYTHLMRHRCRRNPSRFI